MWFCLSKETHIQIFCWFQPSPPHLLKKITTMKMPASRASLLLWIIWVLTAATTETHSFSWTKLIRLPLLDFATPSSTKTSLHLTSLSSETKEDDDSAEIDFFIRPSMVADLGRASEILTEGFFKGRVNILIYQWERLFTYLSLEWTHNNKSAFRELIVACDSKSGKVLGMVELDARISRTSSQTEQNLQQSQPTAIPANAECSGPYMCNLAVDPKCQRRGIATALIKKCEEMAHQWYCQTKKGTVDQSSRISNSVLLKVTESNIAAVTMYDKLGYRSFAQEIHERTGDTVLVMRKQLNAVSSSESSRAASVSAVSSQ